MKKIIEKKIDETLKAIEKFLLPNSYVIAQSFNDDLIGCKIHLRWDSNSNKINFELELLTELSPDFNFKEIGLNDDIVILSDNQNCIIPNNSINNIIGKQFVSTKNLKGIISRLHTKNLDYNNSQYFRLIVNTKKENITAIFTGNRYYCNGVEYGHGLTSLQINDYNFDIFRCTVSEQNILVIESTDKIDYTSFENICKHILKGLALLTGNWYRDNYYVVSSEETTFEKIDSIHFESLNKSVKTDLEIIKPFDFEIYKKEVYNVNELSTDTLFPAKIFSKIIEKSLSKEAYNRTIEMIIESSSNESVIIRSSMYYVALEAISGLIYHENKAKLKPIKDTQDLSDLLDKLVQKTSEYENKFTSKEFEVINKKIKHLNTPFNVDKPLKVFEFYQIKLSDKYIKLLKNRNDFLHGSIPYSTKVFKSNLLEVNLDSLRVRLLSTILLLKYAGYTGHIRNLAGQFLFDTDRLNDGTIDLKESIFYEI